MSIKWKETGKFVVIIDEENSVLAKLIKDNFIFNLRKRRSEYAVFSLNLEEAEFLIKEYQLTEFPSVLYFKDMKVIYRINGFSYFEQKVKNAA